MNFIPTNEELSALPPPKRMKCAFDALKAGSKELVKIELARKVLNIEKTTNKVFLLKYTYLSK